MAKRRSAGTKNRIISWRAIREFIEAHPEDQSAPMDVKTKPVRFSSEYLALLASFPLRPIRDDAEHRHAIEVVNSLIDRPGLIPDEEDYLDVLGLIVADYYVGTQDAH